MGELGAGVDTRSPQPVVHADSDANLPPPLVIRVENAVARGTALPRLG
jgi:hypothetical protein